VALRQRIRTLPRIRTLRTSTASAALARTLEALIPDQIARDYAESPKACAKRGSVLEIRG
jgi:hypothetical protein